MHVVNSISALLQLFTCAALDMPPPGQYFANPDHTSREQMLDFTLQALHAYNGDVDQAALVVRVNFTRVNYSWS